jgi:hypothetical protein
MDRALALVEPYTREPWVRGAYLVGSASRPFRDATSDFDIEIAADDDAYARLTHAERHVFAMDPERPRRVDYEFLVRPWSELESLPDSTRDLDHYPFVHARVLYDPSGELARLFAEIARLPHDVREARARVGYLEVLYGVRRAGKATDRGAAAMNVRLLAAGAVEAMVKLLFVLEGSWPAMRHWAADELALAGIDAETIGLLAATLEEPRQDRLERLLEVAQARLDAYGLDFHRDIGALRIWAFLSEEGKRAFETWGSR